jgi:hypothetical protein
METDRDWRLAAQTMDCMELSPAPLPLASVGQVIREASHTCVLSSGADDTK